MSQRRKLARQRARAEAPKSEPAELVKVQGQVVDLAAVKRALQQSVASAKPEAGRRTPQPSITGWTGTAARYSELSFDQLIAIIRNAELGLTTDWGDLTRRMLKSDAHLASVWETRIAPIAAARWDLEPGETTREELKPYAERLAAACTEALQAVPDLQRSLLCLLEGIGVGFAGCEIIWGRGTLLGVPAYVPLALIPVHPRRWSFDFRFEMGLYDEGRAPQDLKAAGFEVELLEGRNIAKLPSGKYIVHIPARIHDYPTASGLFMAVARPWWVKQWVTKYWLGGAESGANPRTVAKITQGTVGDDVVDDLQESLETLAADGVAIFREGTDVEWREGVAEASATVWAQLYDTMDAAESKVILGSTLNVEVGDTGGNRALGESQATTTINPRQEIDQAQLWRTIERDLFTFIARYNDHLFPVGTPIPKGHSILADDPVGVDELLCRAKACTNDELRVSRGQAPWNDERGRALVSLDAPAWSQQPAQGVAEPARPFRQPWDQAKALAGKVRTRT